MLLEVSNLSIAYGSNPIVHGANFKLDSGEVLAIVGESGSGKTTIIRAILGCLPNMGKVSGGEIVFNGKNLLENTEDEWLKLSGTDISMVFQDSGSMLDPIQRIGTQSAVVRGSGLLERLHQFFLNHQAYLCTLLLSAL